MATGIPDDEPDENYFENLKWLDQYAPCFRIDAANISVLTEPDEFYQMLKRSFANAKTRILISSLYLGTGQLEKDLIIAIEKSMTQNSGLRTKALFDYTRGLRGPKNSKTMLDSLVKDFETRFTLYLYHTPNLRGMVKRFLPERTNETVGVMHMKIYIADNDLIISGANLSHDYFTNRQDRYIRIRNCESLCDFFESIIDSVGSFSFQAKPNGECVYPNENNLTHPFNGTLHHFSNALGEKIEQILKKYHIQSKEEIKHRQKQQQQDNLTVERSHLFNDCNDDDGEDENAYIYPLLQINDCSIKFDEHVTEKLFKCSPMSSSLYLAVGYFNLTNNFIEYIVKHSAADFKILLSSPEANGFYGSAGFSKNIPDIYSYFEEEFFNYFTQCKQEKRISLHEYKRDKWTYHAKGLWYYPKDNLLPCFTVIGSSNYGYRSMYRDVEAQLLIKSKNESFQKQIDLERKNLYEHTIVVSKEILTNQTRSIPKWLKLFAKSLRSFF